MNDDEARKSLADLVLEEDQCRWGATDTPAAPTTPAIERLADDVRWGFPKSEYARGFNAGIGALIARLAEARSTPAEALDVERLAEAYNLVAGIGDEKRAGFWERVGAEYARLRSPKSDPQPEGGGQ
jgi:hypothetical protein